MANYNKSKKTSSLITREGTYSTTPKSKFISMMKDDGSSKYFPKTKENLEALKRLKGKGDFYDDKRFGKRIIWW